MAIEIYIKRNFTYYLIVIIFPVFTLNTIALIGLFLRTSASDTNIDKVLFLGFFNHLTDQPWFDNANVVGADPGHSGRRDPKNRKRSRPM